MPTTHRATRSLIGEGACRGIRRIAASQETCQMRFHHDLRDQRAKVLSVLHERLGDPVLT